MRLDKFFSEQKILSRREVGEKVRKGCIAVNGKVATKSDVSIDEKRDVVTLDGEVVEYKKYVYVLLNKPSGYVSSTEDPRDKTVLELLPDNLQRLKLFPCGRLDKDTVGLVILTNDGVSAHNALSPKRHVEKKYFFKVADEYSDEDSFAIESGITLADGYATKPCKIERIDNNSGYITLTEGKYHEIKRLFGARGNKIVFLKRISFSSIVLGDLPEGEWRFLTEEEEKIFISVK
ncbi:MAG: rRNA pseudouridine synthase [Clostridia bacterium]|nr:rRNA pseudouridine synthase [Clostridia bacterium]